MNQYAIPRHLDDPELIGFWTLDEFLVMVVPFAAGILLQHIVIGIMAGLVGWYGFRKLKAGRNMYWVLHYAYWYLPGHFFGYKVMPPSHIRLMVG